MKIQSEMGKLKLSYFTKREFAKLHFICKQTYYYWFV